MRHGNALAIFGLFVEGAESEEDIYEDNIA